MLNQNREPQQHFLPSTHSAAYLTQMLTNLFSTVMADYRTSLSLLQQSDAAREFSFFWESKATELHSIAGEALNVLCIETDIGMPEQET